MVTFELWRSAPPRACAPAGRPHCVPETWTRQTMARSCNAGILPTLLAVGGRDAPQTAAETAALPSAAEEGPDVSRKAAKHAKQDIPSPLGEAPLGVLARGQPRQHAP